MIKVYINNDQSVFAISPSLKRAARNAARVTLGYLDFTSRSSEISLTFTDNEKIHGLNLKFRNIDRPTDVLSFPLIDWNSVTPDEGICSGLPISLGDIVISLEKAYEQAKEYGHTLMHEVQFLTVHSTLHLMGYDHETSENDEKEMFAMQEIIMSLLNGENQ